MAGTSPPRSRSFYPAASGDGKTADRRAPYGAVELLPARIPGSGMETGFLTPGVVSAL
jgi:hypothetical protein